MVKDPASRYSPGRRGLGWLKMKKALATIDCVVVGVEVGHGKRHGVLSDYTFAVRDEATGKLVTIGKAYSGLTDAEIAEMTAWFEAHTIAAVRSLPPGRADVVVEIAFDVIVRSQPPRSRLLAALPADRHPAAATSRSTRSTPSKRSTRPVRGPPARRRTAGDRGRQDALRRARSGRLRGPPAARMLCPCTTRRGREPADRAHPLHRRVHRPRHGETRERRVTDILNHAEHEFLVLPETTSRRVRHARPPSSPSTPRSTSACVLFAWPTTPWSRSRAADAQGARRGPDLVPPFRITGGSTCCPSATCATR